MVKKFVPLDFNLEMIVLVILVFLIIVEGCYEMDFFLSACCKKFVSLNFNLEMLMMT